jgi:hypothetical protein
MTMEDRRALVPSLRDEGKNQIKLKMERVAKKERSCVIPTHDILKKAKLGRQHKDEWLPGIGNTERVEGWTDNRQSTVFRAEKLFCMIL